MLRKLRVRGFKSLADVTVEFPRLSVLFGPNSAGKSNLLDSIQALSRIGTQRTLVDALDGRMIRGYAFELFALPQGGVSGLTSRSEARFSIEADLSIPEGQNDRKALYRYGVNVEIGYRSGTLANRGEYLSALSKGGDPKGRPAIEVTNGQISVRRQSGGGGPRLEEAGLNYAILSDARFASPAYRYIERARSELQNWRAYYLDPRVAMRAAMPPMDVTDIGVFGQYIVPFLYKLKGERPKHYESVRRTVRSIIPAVSGFDVDIDSRGTLDFFIRQDGITVSSRIVSEGTLRVLALCALTVNPWNGSLLAFEEPENGVHPRRIELIAQMLTSLALGQGRQVVVTTHSPLFCDAVLKEARARSTDDVGLFRLFTCRGGWGGSEAES
ncbi:MAG: AAA family ATPase [Gemmatimonadota bacterium]|nr:AAA family ATPase [Gemmatimonadota bacterium]